jgi:chromosome segregation ATPase
MENKMSVAQELRTIQAQLEARDAELKNANVTIQTLQDSASTAQATIDEQAARLAEQVTAITGHEAAMQDLRDGHAAATADMTTRLAALEAENAGMKTKLQNPAFVLASVDGEDPKTAGGGGEAENDPMPTWAQYNAIKDPAARNAFWEAHSAVLQAEQRAAAGK